MVLRFAIISSLLLNIPLCAQMRVNVGIDTAEIHALIAQPTLTITNIKVTCDSLAYGEFEGRSELPMTHGLFIGTGRGSEAFSRNDKENATTAFGTMDTIPGLIPRHDVCAIEFDVRSSDSIISFIFAFGSEEYPEYVNSGFNDVFTILINGPRPDFAANYNNLNIAYLPDSSSTCINHVNTTSNTQVFYDNTFPHGTFIEYDGLTSYLRASIAVKPDSLYHVTFAIGDQDDPYFDSGGFIAAEDSELRRLDSLPPAGIDCYPNPVSDFLEWMPTQGLGIRSVHLYDDIGRLVYLVSDPREQRSIDMRNYAPGLYILHIETAFFTYTFRVIKI